MWTETIGVKISHKHNHLLLFVVPDFRVYSKRSLNLSVQREFNLQRNISMCIQLRALTRNTTGNCTNKTLKPTWTYMHSHHLHACVCVSMPCTSDAQTLRAAASVAANWRTVAASQSANCHLGFGSMLTTACNQSVNKYKLGMVNNIKRCIFCCLWHHNYSEMCDCGAQH